MSTRTDITFSIIKPDAVKANNIGSILKMIEEKGFKITAMQMLKPERETLEAFYAIHKDRPFFGELIDFMCSGKLVVLALQRDNAVESFRNLMGATNPVEAKDGTIRKHYATNIGENAVHGSDSNENAEREISFFFDLKEL